MPPKRETFTGRGCQQEILLKRRRVTRQVSNLDYAIITSHSNAMGSDCGFINKISNLNKEKKLMAE